MAWMVPFSPVPPCRAANTTSTPPSVAACSALDCPERIIARASEAGGASLTRELRKRTSSAPLSSPRDVSIASTSCPAARNASTTCAPLAIETSRSSLVPPNSTAILSGLVCISTDLLFVCVVRWVSGYVLRVAAKYSTSSQTQFSQDLFGKEIARRTVRTGAASQHDLQFGQDRQAVRPSQLREVARHGAAREWGNRESGFEHAEKTHQTRALVRRAIGDLRPLQRVNGICARDTARPEQRHRQRPLLPDFAPAGDSTRPHHRLEADEVAAQALHAGHAGEVDLVVPDERGERVARHADHLNLDLRIARRKLAQHRRQQR